MLLCEICQYSNIIIINFPVQLQILIQSTSIVNEASICYVRVILHVHDAS